MLLIAITKSRLTILTTMTTVMVQIMFIIEWHNIAILQKEGPIIWILSVPWYARGFNTYYRVQKPP